MVLHRFGRAGQGLKNQLDLVMARVLVVDGPEVQTARTAVLEDELRAEDDQRLRDWVAFIFDVPSSQLPKIGSQPAQLFVGRERVSGTLVESSREGILLIADRFLGWEPLERPDRLERRLCVVLRLQAVWHPDVLTATSELHAT